MADPVEVMARAMIGDERYEALPGFLTYLEHKSMPHGAEWSDRYELHADLSRALSALDAAGFAVVPKDLLGGVVDSLRAASFEYEERDLYPGAVKIMSAQIAMLSAAQVKP